VVRGGTSTLGTGAVQLFTAETAFATANSGADAEMPSSDVCRPIALALAPEEMERVSPETKRADTNPVLRRARRRSSRRVLVDAPLVD
jgi:hypothetical protein